MSYKEILLEIGKHLRQRKGLIVRRVLSFGWPALVLMGLLIHLGINSEYMSEAEIFEFAKYLVGWLVFCYIYVGIGASIFAIEKRVWVDSYFDGKDLTPTESWRIARRLLLPVAYFWLMVIIRYYLLPTLLYVTYLVVTIGGFGEYRDSVAPEDPSRVLLLMMVIGVALASLAYGIYMRFYLFLEMRFLWFIFLDHYGQSDFSFNGVMTKQRELNQVVKKSGYKRALVLSVGTNAASHIASFAVNQIGKGVGISMGVLPGRAERYVSGVSKVLADDLAQQVISLGNYIAFYILYREARIIASQDEVTINEALYSLAKARK